MARIYLVYREFGRLSINTEKARSAYGGLLDKLGFPEARVVFSTTNYDTSIEVGLQAIGTIPNDGFPPTSWERPFLTPVGMVDWDSGHKGSVPVLHLHGAVGWYFEPKGQIARQYPDQSYNPSLGVPAILPPDPNKEPTSSPFVGVIWSEFIRALQGSTHVLILGHSLNDRALMKTVFKEGRHALKGLAVHSVGLTAPIKSEEELVGAWIDPQDPRIFLIPTEFGPKPGFSESAFQEWVDASTF